MRRRAFIALAASVVLRASAAASQSPNSPRIGYLSLRSGPSHLDDAFQQALRDLGYVEAQNLVVEYRWADWKPDRLSALAEELVRLKTDVIVVTGGNAAVLAVKKAVKAMPVVFASGDPVSAGIVSRLDRPGGNLTGVNLVTTELNAKRLELLAAAVPGVVRVAVLTNPTAPPAASVLKNVEDAARALNVKLRIAAARTAAEIDRVLAPLTRQHVDALLVVANPLFFAERDRIVRMAALNRLPGVFEWREFVEAGGFLSYGPNISDMYRRLALYVDKILKGARPGDLPVEQPTKFELVLNVRTGRALGLTVPPPLLLRADAVVE